MKMLKSELRQLIKEQTARLVREMNPDGTISANEEDERYDLLAMAEEQIDTLIQTVISEADRIGGGFRGPGIRSEVLKLLAVKINEAR